jgi:tRNA (mo5U34)-methyltransferase
MFPTVRMRKPREHRSRVPAVHEGVPAAEARAGDGLRARVAEAGPWYHTLDLGSGVLTEGMFDLRPLVGRYGLPRDLSGMRVLDVGTFDGFWAFEMERRGGEVTSLDVDRIQQLDWPPRLRPAEDGPRGQTFRIAHEALGSSVQRVGCSIYDATPERLGCQFDLVFCGSVLIHLRDPMLALERMAGLCTGRLILAEEHTRRLGMLLSGASARFTGASPWSTWWIPTARTWTEMVRVAGFEDVRRHGTFTMRFRGKRRGVPHVVVHARSA